MAHNPPMGAFDDLGDRVSHLGDMRCQHAVELVTDYLEGALTPREERRFERHVRGCPECTMYVEQVRLTMDALGRVHPVPPTGRVRDALLQAFRDFSSG